MVSSPGPLQKVYAYLVIGSIFVRVPWWCLKHLIPAARPRKAMALKKCVLLEVIRTFQTEGAAIDVITQLPSWRNLELAEGIQGLWVDPLPDSFVTGKLQEWARIAKVSPRRIPGYWIHKPIDGAKQIEMGARPSPDEKIVFSLHGGSYMYLTGHPNHIVANCAKGILEAVPTVTRVFSLEYRLSALPGKGVPADEQNPFPAALMDALAGYQYLVNVVGCKESQVVVLGDSAGGNLAHALIRYLIEHRTYASTSDMDAHLPDVPGALILSSPWVDMTGSFAHDPTSFHYTNLPTDFMRFPDPPNQISAPASFVAPFYPDFIKDVYVSPGSKDIADDAVDFAGFPKTFITAGGGEVMLDQIRLFKERMKRSIGDNVVYFEAEYAHHSCMTVKIAQPERKETLAAIRTFLGR